MNASVAAPAFPPTAAHARPDDHVVVLWGATGDLARRKLLPGLYRLAQAGLMPDGYRIVATSRQDLDDDSLRRLAHDAVTAATGAPPSPAAWAPFARRLTASLPTAAPLARAVEDARIELGGRARLLHYLATPAAALDGILAELAAEGLAADAGVVLEKPFGDDLASARALNERLRAVFTESQIFRIDHFLGRETVQNILALRFANGIFEPIWNRDHIDHVRIDVPEADGVGSRGAAYDETGAFRDMVVTHLFHVLALVAMEPPVSFEPGNLVDEAMKVLDAIAPLAPEDVVLGQYDGYGREAGVAAGSRTETFAAARVAVDNWRWAGVPFHLRTGKRLAPGRRVVTIAFRDPPLRMFGDVDGYASNELAVELGESGSISATFLAKVPGQTMRLAPARLSLDHGGAVAGAQQLAAYERLIHDALLGNGTRFARADGIERIWEISAPVLERPLPLHRYAPGSRGPRAADDVLARGR